jgi:hypothetical protein
MRFQYNVNVMSLGEVSVIYRQVEQSRRNIMVKSKRIFAGAMIVIMIVLAVSLSMLKETTGMPKNVVAFINDEPVEMNEFRLISALAVKHGDLLEDIQQKMIEVKVIQQEAKRHHLLHESAYSLFLEELNNENTKRRLALKNNEVIYGPKTYTEQMYYSYRQSNLYNSLKTIWEQQEADLSEKRLLDFYEQHKDNLARKPDDMTIYRIVESVSGSDSDDWDERYGEARERILKIRSKMNNGADFLRVYEAYQAAGGITEMETIDETNYLSVSKYRSGYYDLVAGLEQGEISEIWESDGSFSISYIVKREDQGYIDFEAVREEVISRFIEQGFDAYVAAKAAQADVRFTDLFEHQAGIKD